MWAGDEVSEAFDIYSNIGSCSVQVQPLQCIQTQSVGFNEQRQSSVLKTTHSNSATNRVNQIHKADTTGGRECCGKYFQLSQKVPSDGNYACQSRFS